MSEPITNIVLVGRTGNGISSTGNTLLGENFFKSKRQAIGVTMECEMYRAAIQDGPIINVIDTPGLCDLSVSKDDISKEIINCLTMAPKGIHAVLLVLSARNRVSQEEEATLNTLQSIFDCKILDYFIVVFTGGDDLEQDNQTLDDYFREGCPEFLTKVLRLCGERTVLFNNRTTDETKKDKQLKELLAHVTDIGEKTGGIPYTYQMHRKIQEEHEKLIEQERAIEAKRLAEAELAVREEKMRMDQEMIAVAEENGRLKEQERAIEANKLAEANLALVKEELRMVQEKNIQIMAEEAKRLKEEEQRKIDSKKVAAVSRTHIIYARDLSITWSESSEYWSWVPHQYDPLSNTILEAAALIEVWWLEVNGHFDARQLTPWTHYEVVYLLKLKKSATGWEGPVNLKLMLPSGGKPQERNVTLKEYVGKSWVAIPVGDFVTTPENSIGNISFSMTETKNRQEGLIVKGAAIRPKR